MSSFYRNPVGLVFYSLKILKYFLLLWIVTLVIKQYSNWIMIASQKDLLNSLEIISMETRYVSFILAAKWFFFSLIFFIIIESIENILTEYIAVNSALIATNRGINNIQKQDFEFFKNRHGGMLNSYLNNILNMKLKCIFNATTYIISIAIDIAILFQINSSIAIFLIFWTIISFCILYLFSYMLSYYSRKFTKAKAKLSAYFSDFCNNFLTLITSSFFKKESKISQDIGVYVHQKYLNVMFLKTLQYLGLALSVIILNFYVLFMIYKLKIEQNILTIGEIILIFQLTMRIFWYLLSLVKQIVVISEEYGTIYQATKHIFFEDNSPTFKTKIKLSESPSIEFRSIYFQHNEEQIFTDFSLTINKGEKIGIVGKTGSGKTTLTHLLLNMISPEKGKIFIDDHNIAKINKEELRKSIAFVSQNVEILSRSIRENMLLSVDENKISEEEFQYIAELSLCNEFALLLKDRYNTKVGENGVMLSGGQKQRISIARALFKNANIIIFDEATSALDNITEKILQNTLNTTFKNKTCIFIAHRLTTLKNMDRIIVIEKGKIVEIGSHTELLQNKKYYYNLWVAHD